jgi:hypothetical protein
MILNTIYGRVAQLAEQSVVCGKVAGSWPVAPAIFTQLKSAELLQAAQPK